MPAAPPDRWHDLVNHLTAIRGRAQATRRRITRVKRLSRAHIAADLAQIESATDRLVAALAEERGERRRPGGPEASMAERDRDRQAGEDHATTWPADRRGRDGAAGLGDVLGGCGAGAGDRLGPDAADVAGADPEARPGPNQHSFAGEAFATDAARTDHGRDDPIERGGTAMATVTDPVCGTQLDSSQAAAQAVHDGVAYYFCSEECRDTFLEDPKQYVEAGDR